PAETPATPRRPRTASAARAERRGTALVGQRRAASIARANRAAPAASSSAPGTIVPEASTTIPATRPAKPRASASTGGTTPKILGSAEATWIAGSAGRLSPGVWACISVTSPSATVCLSPQPSGPKPMQAGVQIGIRAPLASLKREESAMPECTHLDQVKVTQLPETTEGCEECLKTGDPWCHLRICLTCGKVGCCDSSP